MLLTIALISVSSVTGFASLYTSLENAQETVMRYNVKVLTQYVEIYYLDYGSYPERLEDLVSVGYFNELPLNPYTEKPDFNYDQTAGRIYFEPAN